jgi:membrane-associated phospholipid phosphatase
VRVKLLADRSPRLSGLIAAFGVAAFVALGFAISVGVLRGFDQWSVDHVMIWVGAGQPSWISTNLPLFPSGYHPLHPFGALAVNVVRLPASVGPWMLLYGAALALLLRRGLRTATVAFAGIGAAGVVIELGGKHLVERSPVTLTVGSSVGQVDALTASFPSGHMLRGVLLAGVLAFLWPRLFPLLVAWVALLGPMLVLGGVHLPSDVLGGLVIAIALVVTANGVSCGSAARSRRNDSGGFGREDATGACS